LATVSIDCVTKEFAGGVTAVDDVSLEIDDGEFVVLVGPSGCGKTTLLRMVAGLEDVTQGAIRIGERDVTNLSSKSRDIAMIFQSYALYPHLTVEDNIAFSLKLRRFPKEEIRSRVTAAARTLGLDQLLRRRPSALSGGQRQRVAMGRAIVREPSAFLMDEPLSNLDAKLRVQMRSELARLRDRLKTTTIYVTHDQMEAMTLGDRVAVMRDGVLQQIDTPQRLFREPVNLFVASFIGSPAMNVVRARVDGTRISFDGQGFDLGARLPRAATGEVILGIRPSDLTDASQQERNGGMTLEVVPDVVEDLGDELLVLFTIDAPPVRTDAVTAAAEASHDDVAILRDGEVERAVFTARLMSGSHAKAGEPLTLSVDPEKFFFFDPENGLRIDRD
jgi:multiple sugar transport system ATP-binding protein